MYARVCITYAVVIPGAKVHQDKLAADSPCQMFVASEGQWVDAIVLALEASTGSAAGGSSRRWATNV